MLNLTETIDYDWVEVETSRVNTKIDQFIRNVQIPESVASYVVGFGGIDRSVFNEIDSLSGSNVVWKGSVSGFPFSLLSAFIPDQRGVVRVSNGLSANFVLDKLTSQACAILYIFPKTYSKTFEKLAIKDQQQLHFGILNLESYFILGFDGDASHVTSGWMEIGSWKNVADLGIGVYS